MTTTAPTASTIADHLRTTTYRYANEAELQDHIEARLASLGLPVQREVRLSPTCRVDLLVDRVAIEVKVAGSSGSVLRQIIRYAADPAIDAVVLVTTKRQHRMPETVSGVPVHVVLVNGDHL